MNDVEQRLDSIEKRVLKLEQIEKRRKIWKMVAIITTIIATILMMIVYYRFMSTILTNLGGSLL